MGEGGQGGIVRIDFSADGKRVRAEALGPGATSLADSTTIATILFSAESGDVCEDQNVSRVCVLAFRGCVLRTVGIAPARQFL